MKIKAMLGIILILGFIVSAYFISDLTNQQNTNGINDIGIPTTTPAEKGAISPTLPVISDWIDYSLPENQVSFSYPPQMELSANEDGSIRLVLIGASQALNTEVYDGLIITFTVESHQEKNLKTYTENIAMEKRKDPIYENVSTPETIIINGIEGYKFTESALGTFTNIYLPIENNSFLRVSYLLEDPGKAGFQKILDSILDKIVLNK